MSEVKILKKIISRSEGREAKSKIFKIIKDKVSPEISLKKKPHINVSTIGHVDAGKSTTSNAIVSLTYRLAKKRIVDKVLANFSPSDSTEISREDVENFIELYAGKPDPTSIDKSREEKERKITIRASHVEFETDNYHYTLIDCPGHLDYIKNMIVGSSQVNICILLIDAGKGFEEQTREHVILIRQLGINFICVLINKVDSVDPSFAEITQQTVNQELLAHGFKEDNISFDFCSSIKALNGDELENERLQTLLSNVDNFSSKLDFTSEDSKPFLMYIENVFKITGRGTVVTGTVLRGTVKINDTVEVLGLRDEIYSCNVAGIESHNQKLIDGAKTNDNIGLNLKVLGGVQVSLKKGQAVSQPGTMQLHQVMILTAYFLTKDEGGRSTHISVGFMFSFIYKTTEVSGRLEKIYSDSPIINPGENVKIKISLLKPVPVELNNKVSLRESKKTIASCVITEILE